MIEVTVDRDGREFVRQRSKSLYVARRRLLKAAALGGAALALGGLVGPMPLTSNVEACGGAGRTESLGFGTGTGTTVTASSTAGTKGSAATIGTATFDYDYIVLQQVAGSTGQRGRLDILATPPGGSAQVIVPDLVIDHQEESSYDGPAQLMAKVPRGSVLSAKYASSTGSDTVVIGINGCQGAPGQWCESGYSRMVSCTDFSASSPYVDPVALITTIPDTSNAPSTPISINPSGYVGMPRLAGIAVMMTSAGNAQTPHGGNVLIGYGTSSSNVVNFLRYANNQVPGNWYMGPYFFDIPAGTQLWVSAWCDATGTGNWGFGIEGVAA